MPCTTHHNACDCREAEFARIKLERDMLEQSVRALLRCHKRLAHSAKVEHECHVVRQARVALGDPNA